MKSGTCEITRESGNEIIGEACYVLTVKNDEDGYSKSWAITESELLDIQECVNQMRLHGELDNQIKQGL